MIIGSGFGSLERALIRYEWQRYSGFLDIMEPHLAQLTIDWYQHMEEEAQQIEDEYQRDEFYSFYADDYEDFHQFNVILTNSFFVSSYFFFEHRLMRLCQRSKTIHDSRFSVNDMGGRSHLGRAKTYMVRLGVSFPSDTQEWRDIKIYNRIRNAIVHNGAIVSPNWTDIDFTRRKGILAGTESNPSLELTRSFCDEAVNTFQRFLISVLDADPRQ